MKRNLTFALSLTLLLAMGCDNKDAGGKKKGATSQGATQTKGGDKKDITVAYVTNGIASFWTIAEKGANAAAKELNVNVEVRMPPDGVGDQKRMLQELITLGVDGVAVSPINPDNQGDILNEVASRTNLITHDSDAPKSDRLMYIGMDNYQAGRMCGKLVKQAIPEGGEVMIFVGRLGQLNADLRNQGVIDELLDRSEDPNRRDKPGEVLKGEKYTILGTRTDGFDFAAAKAQAEDTIAKYENVKCMVGLFAYNPPYILEALKGADKLGKIKVVAFDEEGPTLQGIKDGHVHGTVVQNPYMYGYRSVEVLTALAQGKKDVIPASKFEDIPARSITKENVDEFWAKLKELTGEAEPAKKD